jgi:hypothetical protein
MNGILLLPENMTKSMWSKYAQTQDCPSQLGVSFLVGSQFQWIIITFPISMAIWPFGYTPSDIANSCPGVLKLLYSVLPPDITRHGTAATVNRAIWRWNVCQRHLHDSRYVWYALIARRQFKWPYIYVYIYMYMIKHISMGFLSIYSWHVWLQHTWCHGSSDCDWAEPRAVAFSISNKWGITGDTPSHHGFQY